MKEGGNILTVEVSSEDGSRTKVYRIHVKRLGRSDASLSSLRLTTGKTTHALIPAFASGTTEYAPSRTRILRP